MNSERGPHQRRTSTNYLANMAYVCTYSTVGCAQYSRDRTVGCRLCTSRVWRSHFWKRKNTTHNGRGNEVVFETLAGGISSDNLLSAVSLQTMGKNIQGIFRHHCQSVGSMLWRKPSAAVQSLFMLANMTQLTIRNGEPLFQVECD
jgi:hypothetical protein